MKTRRAMRRTVAGIGALTLGGLGLLAPTAAMAEDVPTIASNNITVTSTLISNDNAMAKNLFGYGLYEGLMLQVKVDGCSPCSEDGCRDFDYHSYINFDHTTGVNLTDVLPTGNRGLGADGVPGIYAYTVKMDTNDNGQIAVSQAQYLIRIAVKKNGDTNVIDWVTATKTHDDLGNPLVDDPDTDDVNEGPYKVDEIKFVNISEDTSEFEVVKTVENNSGLNELSTYSMQVVFGWPANFDGAVNAATGKWSDTTPNVQPASDTEATGTQCTPNVTTKQTTCTFSLAKDKKARFTGVPAGATYTVTETATGSFDKSYTNQTGTVSLQASDAIYPAIANEAECDARIAQLQAQYGEDKIDGSFELYDDHDDMPLCIIAFADGLSLVDRTIVTNIYNSITPTGLLLEYVPYVLMLLIPVAGVASYVALRRKVLR